MTTPPTVKERLLATSADQQALAKRLVAAQIATAELKTLVEPEIESLNEEAALAQERRADTKKAIDDIRAQRKGLRKLFMNRQTKDNLSYSMTEAIYGDVAAIREEDRVGGLLSKAKKRRAALEKTIRLLRTDAKTRDDTDALYAAVFDGPTPDHPDEDSLEAAVQEAKAAYHAIQTRLSKAAAVVNMVSTASGDLRGAVSDIQYAIKMSERELKESVDGPKLENLFNAGYAEFMQRNSLGAAKKRIDSSEKRLAEAREMDPEVGELFKPDVDSSDITDENRDIMDVWFKTPISIYIFQRKMGLTLQGVEDCLNKLLEEVELANSRTVPLAKERDVALAKFKKLEEELTELRAKILRDVIEVAL